jgi:hypothetical protein
MKKQEIPQVVCVSPTVYFSKDAKSLQHDAETAQIVQTLFHTDILMRKSHPALEP